MADSGDIQTHPHIALFPSSGMGHLMPFVRLAATLATHNCRVTFITTHPTVSLAESRLISRLLSSFPHSITPKEFHLLPFDPSTANSKDPFFLQFEAIRRSVHLLSPLLTSSSPPLSALVTDITLAAASIAVTHHLHLPNYILFTSSAKMLSLCAYFHALTGVTLSDEIEIPGLPPLPKTWIPPLLLDQTSLFATQFIANGEALARSNGILINTFEYLEPESLAALNEGKVVNGLPPVIQMGPLVPCECEPDSERGGSSLLEWLDEKEKGSVAYVSFGSRTAMSREQIREVGEGLVKSGCGFVWVVKEKKVDRDEEGEGLEEVVGGELMERIVKEGKGVVVKKWVDQEEILSHTAVGGFVSHCGWNSVTEAAWHGVRMLAWPQGGDQRINAEVVDRSGVGVWVRSWGWSGGGGEMVKAEEIGKRVREMMGDEQLRVQAAQVRDEARNSVGLGGKSSPTTGFLERLQHTMEFNSQQNH